MDRHLDSYLEHTREAMDKDDIDKHCPSYEDDPRYLGASGKLFSRLSDSRSAFDYWSFCHTFLGILTGLLGIPIIVAVVLHQAWEIFENRRQPQEQREAEWQKVKPWADKLGLGWTHAYYGDTAQNSAGDTLAFVMGWAMGYYIRSKQNPLLLGSGLALDGKDISKVT